MTWAKLRIHTSRETTCIDYDIGMETVRTVSIFLKLKTLKPKQNRWHFHIFVAFLFQFKVRQKFPIVQLTIRRHWLDHDLASNSRQVIIQTSDGQVYWRTYLSFCLDGLIELPTVISKTWTVNYSKVLSIPYIVISIYSNFLFVTPSPI